MITEDILDREIKLERLLNAPVDLVWLVWSQAEHIKNWWGPNGFTNTIHKMDLQAGGEWDLIMHGSDGIDYVNKSVFKEVIPKERIVYEHISEPRFTSTITFKAIGNTTLLTWHMLFDSKEQFIEVVKKYGADEGLRQNVEKMELYLGAFKM